ncbi:MAG: aminotransferase class I/II-fold pyridoxal phosphate-dependent enzyme [Holophagaceae bacterium]|nr:aminotransferase class I/II-fold pyridoxal phosphate-dependent enzyme [Holophagaceae bacterium]
MLHNLLPSRRDFPADDPIFALNTEAQSRVAKGERIINATVGALLDDNGQIVILDTVMELWRELTPKEIAPYAPISGDPAYLTAMVQRYWPELAYFGTGCATPGGSGALALSVRNFLEPGQAILTLAPYWGPYDTIAQENGAHVETFPMPEPGHAIDALALMEKARNILERQGRLLIWLNDPCHNPTGRSTSPADRAAILEVLRELCHLGPITLLLDLAYLEYAADPAEVMAALQDYARFAVEGQVLVGASLSVSKTLTLYGARAGALVFPWTRDASLQAALAMSCRGIFSNAPRAPQSLVVRLAKDGKAQARLADEHRHWSEKLSSRAQALSGALRKEELPGVPWQGGFFVTLPAKNPTAVAGRLKDRGVFVVPIPQGLRVGLCGLSARDAPVFASAYKESL